MDTNNRCHLQLITTLIVIICIPQWSESLIYQITNVSYSAQGTPNERFHLCKWRKMIKGVENNQLQGYIKNVEISQTMHIYSFLSVNHNDAIAPAAVITLISLAKNKDARTKTVKSFEADKFEITYSSCFNEKPTGEQGKNSAKVSVRTKCNIDVNEFDNPNITAYQLHSKYDFYCALCSYSQTKLWKQKIDDDDSDQKISVPFEYVEGNMNYEAGYQYFVYYNKNATNSYEWENLELECSSMYTNNRGIQLNSITDIMNECTTGGQTIPYNIDLARTIWKVSKTGNPLKYIKIRQREKFNFETYGANSSEISDSQKSVFIQFFYDTYNTTGLSNIDGSWPVPLKLDLWSGQEEFAVFKKNNTKYESQIHSICQIALNKTKSTCRRLCVNNGCYASNVQSSTIDPTTTTTSMTSTAENMTFPSTTTTTTTASMTSTAENMTFPSTTTTTTTPSLNSTEENMTFFSTTTTESITTAHTYELYFNYTTCDPLNFNIIQNVLVNCTPSEAFTLANFDITAEYRNPNGGGIETIVISDLNDIPLNQYFHKLWVKNKTENKIRFYAYDYFTGIGIFCDGENWVAQQDRFEGRCEKPSRYFLKLNKEDNIIIEKSEHGFTNQTVMDLPTDSCPLVVQESMALSYIDQSNIFDPVFDSSYNVIIPMRKVRGHDKRGEYVFKTIGKYNVIPKDKAKLTTLFHPTSNYQYHTGKCVITDGNGTLWPMHCHGDENSGLFPEKALCQHYYNYTVQYSVLNFNSPVDVLHAMEGCANQSQTLAYPVQDNAGNLNWDEIQSVVQGERCWLAIFEDQQSFWVPFSNELQEVTNDTKQSNRHEFKTHQENLHMAFLSSNVPINDTDWCLLGNRNLTTNSLKFNALKCEDIKPSYRYCQFKKNGPYCSKRILEETVLGGGNLINVSYEKNGYYNKQNGDTAIVIGTKAFVHCKSPNQEFSVIIQCDKIWRAHLKMNGRFDITTSDHNPCTQGYCTLDYILNIPNALSQAAVDAGKSNFRQIEFPENIDVILGNKLLTVECKEGYRFNISLKTKMNIKCLGNDTWDYYDECTPITYCPDPPTFLTQTLRYYATETEFPSRITYKFYCIYLMQSKQNPSVLHCNEFGEWENVTISDPCDNYCPNTDLTNYFGQTYSYNFTNAVDNYTPHENFGIIRCNSLTSNTTAYLTCLEGKWWHNNKLLTKSKQFQAGFKKVDATTSISLNTTDTEGSGCHQLHQKVKSVNLCSSVCLRLVPCSCFYYSSSRQYCIVQLFFDAFVNLTMYENDYVQDWKKYLLKE